MTAPIIVQATLLVATAILTEAGALVPRRRGEPPTPTWGSMIRTGSQYLEVAPWLAFAPGVAIFATVLAFNFVGDGLRRALDPRLLAAATRLGIPGGGVRSRGRPADDRQRHRTTGGVQHPDLGSSHAKSIQEG